MPKALKILIGIFVLLFAGAVLFVYFRTRQQLDYVKNESSEQVEPAVSTLYFPVYIAVDDLQQLANKKLKCILAEETQPMKNQKDSVELKVTRTGNVTFRLKNEQLYTTIPLKVDIVLIKKVGKSAVRIFEKQPLTFTISAHLLSSVDLNEYIQLKTKTQLQSIEWIEEPVAEIAGFQINLKKIVEKKLLEKSTELIATVDQVLTEKVNLVKPVKKVWTNLQKNKPVGKGDSDFYLHVQPQHMGVHIDQSMGDSIRLNLAVQSKLYVRHGSDTSTIEKTPFPKKIEILKQYSGEQQSTIHLHVLLPLQQVNDAVNLQLKGKQVHMKGFTFRISSVSISNGTNNLIGEIGISGDLNGIVKTKGFPQFSKQDATLTINNIGIESRLEEELVNSATDLLHVEILQLLNKYAVIDVAEYLQVIPTLIKEGVQKTKLVQKADVRINEIDINAVDLKLGKDNVQVLITASTDFEIALRKEGLKLKKIENY